MNYNSVEEILAAGTTNMTVLRNNTKQDDGTDSITGVSWFTYNGKTASTIYASGNSFIGFGSSTEDLKVNRRDGALYSLYREEGTLHGYYKFLKIRWKGYSAYNKTTTAYAVVYDVILWDTGSISLHMVSIPSSYNNGIYNLTASTTYSYTVSASKPDVTFIKTDSGFTVSNSIIDLEAPSFYLVRDGVSYYTVIDNALSRIEISDLSSNVFKNSGMIDIPPISVLNNLTNPEIIVWNSSNTYQLNSGLVIKGIPRLPQIIEYGNHDMNDHLGIKNVDCIASTDVLFSVSIDDGQTWKYYDNNSWKDVSTDSDGMNVSVLKSIQPTAWSEIITSTTIFKFRSMLTLPTSYAGIVCINYI